MAIRNYSSNAVAATLTATVTAGATLLPVSSTTGWPTPPFTIIIDRDTVNEEVAEVTNLAGLNATATRGVDGTAAVSHAAGATVVHGLSARDLREPNAHIGATSNVHGLAVGSAVVGTNDTQTLDNKTFQSASAIESSIDVKGQVGQTSAIQRWLDSAGVVLSAVLGTGRITTPGMDGTGSTTLTASPSTTRALILKGASGQSVPIVEVQDSASVVVESTSAAGAKILNSNLATTVIATLKGFAAQSADYLQFRNSANTLIGGFSAAGRMFAQGVDAFADAIGTIPLKVKGFAGQTANLTEWQDSTSAVLAKVDKDGNFDGKNIGSTTLVQSTTNSGTFTTTETVTDTVTASLVVGRRYKVVWDGGWFSTVGGDVVLWQLREDNLAGTGMQRYRFSADLANNAMGGHVEAFYTASATGAKTFVLTGLRSSGTGTITRTATATSPSCLYVEPC